MKHRAEIDMLKDIRKICGARRVRAELEVERVNAQLDGLARQRDAENGRLKTLEDGWEKAVRAASLQLTSSSVWSAEIHRTRAALASTETEIRDRHAARQDLCEVVRSISARDDAVGTLIGRAVRQATRHREEAALENHAVRNVRGWGGVCE